MAFLKIVRNRALSACDRQPIVANRAQLMMALFSSFLTQPRPHPLRVYILHLGLHALQSEQTWQLNEPTQTTCEHLRGLTSHSDLLLTTDPSLYLDRAALHFNLDLYHSR